ncbi:MAG TPA: hypothetical protein VIM44_08810 [Rariglobus sp.]
MPLTTDTTRTASVTEAALDVSRALFPEAPTAFTRELFAGVEKLFKGECPDYQAVDLKYHDYRHTLQVTVAYLDLFAARQRSGASPFTHRQFELGLATALLHDSGYLKLRSDREGTGAKYTFCHVLRSCALAASFLPAYGLKLDEIDTVLGAIRCTGLSAANMGLRFNRHEDHELASLIVTADYLGQMAADDYPDELELLFNEFAESDRFLGIPPAQRIFKSVSQLAAGTGVFWEKVVKPKLEQEYHGVYRYLTRPDGSNPYLDAIARNLAIIARRHALATT